jgi:hypothetical protein
MLTNELTSVVIELSKPLPSADVLSVISGRLATSDE